jgi:hypothetical protein
MRSKQDKAESYWYKCLFSEFQLASNIRPRVWNFFLLGKDETPTLFSPVRQLETALNSLSIPVKEQIWLDVSRLRPNLSMFQRNQVRVVAYCMLCLFCYQREISYFQGLHEILAPFLFLFQAASEDEDASTIHLKGWNEVPPLAIFSPLWKSYPLFCAFLERFAPFLLDPSEQVLVLLLRRAFCYFQTLLVYHSPRVFWTLTEAQVTPDMYCVSWFVTLFAGNLNMEDVLVLYDCFIVSGNEMSIFYFALELMSRHESILFQVNQAMLPETCMHITVHGNYQVCETWLAARTKQSITPQGFHRRFYRAMYETKEYSIESTSNQPIDSLMHLSVEEWIEECNRTPQSADSSSTLLPFFLWDCRSKEEYDAGHLAIAARVPWETFQTNPCPHDSMYCPYCHPYPSNQVLNQAIALFEPLRNIVRICLIGSGDEILDQMDVYPLALALTRSHFRYVCILSGGIHSILEYKKPQGTIPHGLDWVDLDRAKQKWMEEERRKARLTESSSSSSEARPSFFGWNSQPILDLRLSLNRIFKKG